MVCTSPSNFVGFVRSPAPSVEQPAVCKHDQIAWAAKTPVTSPMCWNVNEAVEARRDDVITTASPPITELVSREMLRAVCEPFVEQMITALQTALVQVQQSQQEQGAPPSDQNVSEKADSYMASSATSTSSIQQQGASPFCSALVEESCETDDSGAFATIISSHSSSDSGCDYLDELPLELAPKTSSPTADNPLPGADLELSLQPGKSVMVCRHWKAKGECRMGTDCKFRHPEDKRGPKVPKAGVKVVGSAAHADSSSLDADVPLATAPVIKKKRSRGGRKCAKQRSAQHDAPNSDEMEEMLPERLLDTTGDMSAQHDAPTSDEMEEMLPQRLLDTTGDVLAAPAL